MTASHVRVTCEAAGCDELTIWPVALKPFILPDGWSVRQDERDRPRVLCRYCSPLRFIHFRTLPRE